MSNGYFLEKSGFKIKKMLEGIYKSGQGRPFNKVYYVVMSKVMDEVSFRRWKHIGNKATVIRIADEKSYQKALKAVKKDLSVFYFMDGLHRSGAFPMGHPLRDYYVETYRPIGHFRDGYVMGVDPGTIAGLSLTRVKDGKLLKLWSGNNYEMKMQMLDFATSQNAPVFVVLEDVSADATNFVAAQKLRSMKLNAVCNMSRSSGMVAGFSREWRNFLEYHSIRHYCLPPSHRTNVEVRLSKNIMDNTSYAAQAVRQLEYPTKVSAPVFDLLTSWTGRSNEHNRDAALGAHFYLKKHLF